MRQPLHYYEQSEEVAMESLFNFCALFTATWIIKCVLVCKVIWLSKHTRWLWRYIVSVWNKFFFINYNTNFSENILSKYSFLIMVFVKTTKQFHLHILSILVWIFSFINYIGLCFVWALTPNMIIKYNSESYWYS